MQFFHAYQIHCCIEWKLGGCFSYSYFVVVVVVVVVVVIIIIIIIIIIVIIIELTHNLTLENTVEIEPQPVALYFKNSSQYSSRSK